jgi:hypothetical protein
MRRMPSSNGRDLGLNLLRVFAIGGRAGSVTAAAISIPS